MGVPRIGVIVSVQVPTGRPVREYSPSKSVTVDLLQQLTLAAIIGLPSSSVTVPVRFPEGLSRYVL